MTSSTFFKVHREYQNLKYMLWMQWKSKWHNLIDSDTKSFIGNTPTRNFVISIYHIWIRLSSRITFIRLYIDRLSFLITIWFETSILFPILLRIRFIYKSLNFIRLHKSHWLFQSDIAQLKSLWTTLRITFLYIFLFDRNYLERNIYLRKAALLYQKIRDENLNVNTWKDF